MATKKKNGVTHGLGKAIVTVVNGKTDLNTKIFPGAEEDYRPSSRRWSAMPSVIVCGKNIFVAWQTGGTTEDDRNYFAVAASADGGASWIDPFIIIDPVENPTATSVLVPIFYYNHAGDLWLTWHQTAVGYCGVKLLNAGGGLGDISFEGPFTLKEGIPPACTKPTLLSDGRILYMGGNETITRLYVSENDGMSVRLLAEIPSSYPSAKVCTDATVIEKRDGTLWFLSRLEGGKNGGIEQSFSRDGGLTWTPTQADLPEPLRGPGSRFAMRRLQSGALLLVNNASVAGGYAGRVMMTAYLSYDDGATWPYSLLLDKTVTAYPDFYQAPDGKIYIAFEKGRYKENGIRLCVVTEDDIKAGAFVSKAALDVSIVK